MFSREKSEDFSSLCLSLAERVAAPEVMGLERRTISSLDTIRNMLLQDVPGIETSKGQCVGEELQSQADLALKQKDPKLALSHALNGLVHWPHSPTLMCTAGMACYELGELHLALRLVDYAVWVNPGYLHAKHCKAKLLDECKRRFKEAPRLLTVTPSSI